MGANKNFSRRSNSAYAPNSQPRIPTRVCQGRVVTTDLPTIGTNPKQYQSESKTQGGKDLTTLLSTRRTVHKHRADRPCGLGGLSAGCGGPSENNSRTTSTAPSITDRPPSTRGPSALLGLSGLSSRTVRPLLADCPASPRGLSAKPCATKTHDQMDQNEGAQEHTTNKKNTRLTGSTRTVRAYQADCPPGANRRGNSRPRART
jgi:hypothetical protein